MEGVFSKEVFNDDSVSVITDNCDESKNLVVVFGGIANKLPIPVFEFFKSLDKYNLNKVFVRDFNQSWYQGGLRGISSDLIGTLDYLESIINKKDYDKVVFLGNSAGGFAAILFGWLLNIDEVHAFSPQSFTDSLNRFIYQDKRWPKQIKNIRNCKGVKYQDLKKIQNQIKDTKTFLYWDSTYKLDHIHSKRLNNPKIVRKEYPEGGHNLIKNLKLSGELNVILDSIFKV